MRKVRAPPPAVGARDTPGSPEIHIGSGTQLLQVRTATPDSLSEHSASFGSRCLTDVVGDAATPPARHGCIIVTLSTERTSSGREPPRIRDLFGFAL